MFAQGAFSRLLLLFVVLVWLGFVLVFECGSAWHACLDVCLLLCVSASVVSAWVVPVSCRVGLGRLLVCVCLSF